MKILRGAGVCLCAILLFSATALASSKTLRELERERNNIRGIIGNTQSELTSVQTEMYRTQLEIIGLDEELTIAMDELEIINTSLDETAARLTQSEQELAQARRERDEQFETFKKRLRVMHEYGSVSLLEVLFQAASFRDLLARFEYLNNVAQYDQQLTQRMQEAEDNVSNRVEEIARQRNTIEVLQYAQETKLADIAKMLTEKNVYLEALELDEERFEAKLEQDREDQKVIDAAYAKAKKEDDERRERERIAAQAATAAAIANYNGTMKWPLPGSARITDNYTVRDVHPVTGKRNVMHTGVDIGASMGSNITAADGGRVIMAKYNGGYGNCVIIDHGGGMSTLYGHASKLLVSEGQTVSKGDVIALVGSTGLSTGPHLHFEVRVNGTHTNPRPYLGY